MTAPSAGSPATLETSGPGTGTGGRGPAALPATLAEAEAQHAEMLRRCAKHPVAAVRDECRRQAQRVLDRETARLGASGKPGPAGR